MASSHPYEEPSLAVILVVFGFLFLLNVVNKVLDSLLYCGLVGQIFVGVFFGTPGAKLLNSPVETTISDLGYLGLILLVYEGGLSTSLAGLISSSMMSTAVALTGILLPIALSFVLLPFGVSPLQCFAAGASLSATSLGTAFTTLSTSGLLNTHLGIVLTTAAMLDDVVGLIMLQVVAELSGGHGSASDYGKVIGRALSASVGLVVVVVVVCRLILRPLYTPFSHWFRSPKRPRIFKWVWDGQYTALLLHTSLLLVLVVVGSLAGTSVLLSAFLAGVVIRWWGENVAGSDGTAGLQVYEHYYSPVADQILKPFFFASIGFSIPIAQMFRTTIVWQGVVYTLLMFLGKVATGLWLVPSSLESATRSRIRGSLRSFWHTQKKPGVVDSDSNGTEGKSVDGRRANYKDRQTSHPDASIPIPHPSPQSASQCEPTNGTASPVNVEHLSSLAQNSPPPEYATSSTPPSRISTLPSLSPTSGDVPDGSNKGAEHKPALPAVHPVPQDVETTPSPPPSAAPQAPTGPPPKRALRVYGPVLVGMAMTARGEIGFLIASVAESRGIFASPSRTFNTSERDADSTSSLYLIVVWAIVLCTVVGPIAVGGLVRRVKRMDMQANG